MCITFVKQFFFTSIHSVKTGCFYKSNSESFINMWLIYDVMKYWRVLRYNHLVVVIPDIWFVPITWTRWPFCGKCVNYLAIVLLIACQTNRYINTKVSTCQVLVQWEIFIFCHYLWNTWDYGFVVFLFTKCTVVARLWHTFHLLFVLLKAKCL